jgi:hypothetical protein
MASTSGRRMCVKTGCISVNCVLTAVLDLSRFCVEMGVWMCIICSLAARRTFLVAACSAAVTVSTDRISHRQAITNLYS